MRPIRTLLFVPGNRTEWMSKAADSGTDAIVFDLEGSLPPAAKDSGRQQVRSAIDGAAGRLGPALFVRVNDVRSPELARDLDAVVVPGLAGVLLPQVAGVDDVLELDRRLTELEASRSMEQYGIFLDPLMETPTAIRTAFEIATSTPRIAYMGAGISKRGDIARTVGYQWSEEGLETLYLRSKVLLDVRAAGVVNPLSGMWGDVGDLDGLRRFAVRTRALGYEGMMIIHPTHVPVVNEVFSPTADEIELWQQTVRAMEAAHAEGTGAIRLNGEVVDEAHVLTAQQELARAARLGLVEG